MPRNMWNDIVMNQEKNEKRSQVEPIKSMMFETLWNQKIESSDIEFGGFFGSG